MNWEPIDEGDEAIAHRVIGAAIEVHKDLGPGLLESAYQKALAHELHLRGMAFEEQKLCAVRYKDLLIEDAYRLDFLVGVIHGLNLRECAGTFFKETFFPGARAFAGLFDSHRRTDANSARQENFQKIEDSANCSFVICAKLFVFDAERLDADLLKKAIPNFLLLLALS